MCKSLFTLLSTHLSLMQHRGEIVKRAVQRSGITVVRIRTQLGVSRTTVYNYFHDRDLDLETIMAIGKIIHHDFSDEVKELKGFKQISDSPTEAGDKEFLYGKELKGELHWKDKYYRLLESYTELQRELMECRTKLNSTDVN